GSPGRPRQRLPTQTSLATSHAALPTTSTPFSSGEHPPVPSDEQLPARYQNRRAVLSDSETAFPVALTTRKNHSRVLWESYGEIVSGKLPGGGRAGTARSRPSSDRCGLGCAATVFASRRQNRSARPNSTH